jgi:HEAT repeat protein
VLAQATRLLAAPGWRGQEQAALLLGQLDHKSAVRRLLELIESGRPEVLVAAAWGLRRLAVADTLPPVLDYLRKEHRQLLSKLPRAGRERVPGEAIDRQLAQLAQFLGQALYRPAEPTLRALYPRFLSAGTQNVTPVGGETRAAAIWALGLLNAGKPDASLVSGLEARLNDISTPFIGGDDPRVRRQSAVALGRMKATAALASLRRWYIGPTTDMVSVACAWGAAQATGTQPPPPGTLEIAPIDWFVIPLPP